jgi:PAS domain-containing protein
MRLHLFKPSELESEESSARGVQGNGQLQHGEPSYRNMPNQDLVAVYTCDASGAITYFNDRAAELWGRRPPIGETADRFCGSFMLYRPDGSHMPHELSPMADVLVGKVPGIFDAEVHLKRPDGSRIIVIVNIAPMTNNGGDIVGAINSFYEVTDSKSPTAAN